MAVALVGAARPVAAHATLLETTPANDAVIDAAPASVELRYSEPVAVAGEGIQVYGPDGARVDRGTADLLDGGELVSVPIDSGGKGTHTVAWRVTSEDGHTITGSFVFHVGAVTGGVDIDDSTSGVVTVAGFVGRWLAFAGSLALIGAVLVGLLPGTGPGAAARSRRLALVAAGGATLGALLALGASAAEATGRGLTDALGMIDDFVADQRTGRLAAIRAGVLAAGALALVLTRRRVALVLAGVATAAAIVATSMAGHAWTTSPEALMVVSDVVHQCAVGIWLGGVVAVLVVLAVVDDRRLAARAFSTVALGAVVVVAITGSISGWAQVRSI